MKIESQTLEDHQVKLTVEFEPDQFEEAKRKAARKLAKRVKIPGFRPGKAPYNVIARHLGEEALIEEGVEILVDDVYPKILEEADIQPYGPGKLDNIATYEPLTMEFVVPLRAEVDLGDYESIRLPYEPVSITDEEVEAVVDNLRQRGAIEETVDRPAGENDHLYIRFSASRYEAEQANEKTTLIEERPFSVIIPPVGEDASDEWPFDGFSRELIGASAGDTKTILYTFNEDSNFETLRGETAEFSIQVEDVKSRELPELTDKFAQSLGDYKDIESLKNEIRQSLQTRVDTEYNSEFDDKVVDEVISQATLKYPPQMVENEIDEVVHQLEHRLKSQGLDLDIYMKTREIDVDGLKEEARPVAETRVKRSLVLFKIAELADIQVSEDELKQETDRTIESITQYMAEPDKRKVFSRQALPDLVGNIYAEMRIDRTQEYLRKVAKGEMESGAEPEPVEPQEAKDEAESTGDTIESAEPSEPTAGEPTAESEPAPSTERPSDET